MVASGEEGGEGTQPAVRVLPFSPTPRPSRLPRGAEQGPARPTAVETRSVLSQPRELPAVVVSVTQSCLTVCDPMDCSLLGSSIHEILQARVLEWAAISCTRKTQVHTHRMSTEKEPQAESCELFYLGAK